MKSKRPPDRKPHILILSQYYAPDVTAAAFRITESAELLAGKGYDITVITAVPHRGDAGGASGKSSSNTTRNNVNGSSGDGTGGNEAGRSSEAAGGSVTVLKVPIIPYTGKGKLNYIVHYTSFMLNAIGASMKIRSRPDAVYATSPPLFAALAGWSIALLKGVPFALDVRDLWPESAVSAGQISKGSIFFKVGKLMERHVYKAARFITCVSKPMASAIGAVAPSASVTVIYNGILEKFCEKKPDADQKAGAGAGSGRSGNGADAPNTLASEDAASDASGADTSAASIEKKPVTVLYTGNFGRCQAMDLYLEAARLLKESAEDGIMLSFLGDGVMKEKMERYAADNKLDNITITGPVTKEAAFSEMGKSSALLLALIDDDTMEKTIPSKVFDYMAAGKPVIYGIKGEGKEILEQAGGNLCFDASSPQSLADALKTLKQNLAVLSREALNNAVQVKSQFTRERMVDRLADRFKELLSY
jgi:glycosyltransferase involved in cell wall biosynthesis